MFSYLVEELRRRHPNFGYLHVVESRVQGIFDRDDDALKEESNDFLRAIWAGKPWISAGGFSRESAIKQAELDWARSVIDDIRRGNLVWNPTDFVTR